MKPVKDLVRDFLEGDSHIAVAKSVDNDASVLAYRRVEVFAERELGFTRRLVFLFNTGQLG